MPEPLVTLSGEKPLVMCPIESYHSTYLSQAMCFGTTDRDGSEKRRVCCVNQDASPRLRLPKTPILFNVVGEITVDDCFLTAQGCLRPPDEEPVASCWLQPRPNAASEISWRGIIPTLDAIVNEIDGEVDPSRLLAIGEDGKLRLQVIWQGDVGDPGTDLPIFNEFGTQHVPGSISEVPFGEAVLAVFSIEFVHDRRAGTRTIFASLFTMFKA